jgi:hypothetical protein
MKAAVTNRTFTPDSRRPLPAGFHHRIPETAKPVFISESQVLEPIKKIYARR